MYKLVDALNTIGVSAFAYHQTENYRLTWFENNTVTVGEAEFQEKYDPGSDLVIFPEDTGPCIASFPGKKVIYNQNFYYGQSSLGDGIPKHYPWQDTTILAQLVVSEHNAEHLRFSTPGCEVYRIVHSIDATMFPFVDLLRKKRKVACVAKNARHLRSLQHMLYARAFMGHNAFQDFEWVLLEQMTESEVSTCLQESLFLVFLSTTEGLSLTALEAMSCGCIVVGVKSGSLKEIVPSQCLFEVGDLVSIAQFMEGIAAAHPDRLQYVQTLVESGRLIVAKYSQEHYLKSVQQAWSQLSAKLGLIDRTDEKRLETRLL